VPLRFICLTQRQKETLEALFPGRFQYEADRNGADYLYDIDRRKTGETHVRGVQLPPEEETAEGEEAAEKPLSPQAQDAKKKMQLSYHLRMLMLIAAAGIGVAAPCFHPVAALVPLLFPRLVIMVIGFVQKT